MFSTVLVLYLFPTLVLIVATWVWIGDVRRGSRKGLNVPPGSMGWPLIGETLAFGKRHPCTSVGLGPYVEERVHKYGKIFTSHLLGSPAIVSTDNELNQFVLQNDGKLFEANWPRSIIDMFGKTSMMTTTGEVHRNLKSLSLSFFSIARLKGQLLTETDSVFRQALGAWKETTPFSLTKEASKVTFQLIIKCVLGMNPGDPETDKLHTLFTSLVTGLTAIPIKIPGSAYHKAWKSRNGILKAIKNRMEQRVNKKREGADSIGEDDFLGYLLEHSNLNAEELSDLVLGLLFAGHKSTSTTTSIAVYFLQHCPKALEQLREEHLKIVRMKMQRGEPTMLLWEDYKKMDFANSVLRETLRLGNVAGIVFRKAITGIHFKGYDIPRGWSVIPVLSAAHLDPSKYQEAQKFDPWRWQIGSASSIEKDNYIPFGRGMYKCAGVDLANMMIVVFLHHLIINYSWEPTEADNPFAATFSKFPKGFPIKVHKLNFFK